MYSKRLKEPPSSRMVETEQMALTESRKYSII
jgi:hypothetical protein